MIKKTISYTDYDGVERVEDFYFNLNTIELTRLQGKYENDIPTYITKLSKNNNLMGMVNLLEDLILTSYGEKSVDGRKFIKNEEIREEFSNTIAYAKLFEELFTDQEEAEKFGKGIVSEVRESEALNEFVKNNQ